MNENFPEIESPEGDRFFSDALAHQGELMANYSIGQTPVPNWREVSTDEEIAQILSEVKVNDPHFGAIKVNEAMDAELFEAGSLTIAKAKALSQKAEQKQKGLLNRFADKIAKEVGAVIASKAGNQGLVATAGLALVATACGEAARPVEVAITPETINTTATEVVPTHILLSTPIEDPTTPTTEPTPTPTEVPMYIGIPADQMTTLREQCLQTNPDSLCLPLPISPANQDLQVQEVSEVGVDVDTSNGRLRIEDFYLELPLPFPSTIQSLGDGEMRVFASHPNSMGIWGDRVKARTNLSMFDWLIFQQGPFQGDFPELALVIRKADGSKFSPDDLVLLVDYGQDVSAYQPLVTVGGTDLVLKIYRYGPQRTFAGFSFSESRVTLEDLLRNDAGSIVYTLPPD